MAENAWNTLALAAGSIAQGPATARLINLFGARLDKERAVTIAHDTLKILDKHLQDRDGLAADHPTIADLANYSYIAYAPEGDVSLQEYSQVHAWLARVEALPGFIPMQASAIGLAS